MERIDLETNEESRSVNISFDLRALVHVGANVWRKLRPELEAMDPLLPVMPMLDPLPDHLKMIRDRMLDAERAALDAAIAKVVSLLRDPDQPNKSLRVAHWMNNGGRLGVEWDDPPDWAIRQLSIRATGA